MFQSISILVSLLLKQLIVKKEKKNILFVPWILPSVMSVCVVLHQLEEKLGKQKLVDMKT